ncbi:MAG: bifunctional glutamate N-acetyltransferase/amino-acid acetyltransferase ArgJ [Candidatus Omnitrophica bacterium]|nr:bifunctional glutamate N-acetyltransferase/amino-acid acetyltransferase ArgJ [Candidatus Omnitrophota bacterium]
MRWIKGGVTAAAGFAASGINAGIKTSRKPDLSLVAARQPCSAAAVFTVNRVQAAPVRISKARLQAGAARAVLINSGCANCLTGPAGLKDALAISRSVASALKIPERQLLLASTGIIGRRLPVAKVVRAVPRLVARLHRQHHEVAAQAILTTDLHVKEAAVEQVVGGRRVRVGGMAKGAGMIAPSMATMLAVITTDAALPASLLRRLLRQACDVSFNRISVDGDMSTNDTVFALASGHSGVDVRVGRRAEALVTMLQVVCGRLARLIVQDGEGASKLMEVWVRGAGTEREALCCARQVASSPLVKTMLAGSAPNVGRLAAAAGASGARFDPARLEIHVSGVRVVARGTALPLSAAVTRRLLDRPEVPVVINLHAGRAEARMTTCDLTAEYVHINAGYAT